ncbi:hypothetical protein [Streptomyces genisteinicus]|nr:hypothetical protein [Streptomyces genisteinicus]
MDLAVLTGPSIASGGPVWLIVLVFLLAVAVVTYVAVRRGR